LVADFAQLGGDFGRRQFADFFGSHDGIVIEV
jgi:hypothetical protein